MKTNIYIDGLNLYYRAVQGTPYKWLDIAALFQKMFPQNTVCKIKYFTSLASSRPNDPGKPIRQQIYLRALRTFPNIEIIHGHFLTSKVRMPLVTPSPKGSKTAEVWRTEEKGSDVNLKSKTLLKYASFIREIRPGVLSCSQLPNTLTDASGTFHRPPEWE